MLQVACCSLHRYEESEKQYADFLWYVVRVQQKNVCNKCFCWPEEPCRGFWCCAGNGAYVQHLIVVRVWREDVNRFFKMRFSSSNCALRFWSSFTCLAVRTLPSSISTVEYCFTHLPRSRLWDTVFLAELWLNFAILVKGNEEFFKIFVIFSIVVCSHKEPPFLCIVNCNI